MKKNATYPLSHFLTATIKRFLCIGPRVSIIVPIYNKAPFLIECLESIAKQSFKDIEVICVDDCSSDDSLSIVRQFILNDKRFYCYQSQQHLGPGLARNKGMELASGKFLQFVDADDILPDKSIETLYRLITNDKVNAARGGIAVFTQDDVSSIISADIPPNIHAKRFADHPHFWIPWWHTTYMFSNSMIRKNRISYPALKDGEDPVFLANVLTKADLISSIENIVYLYRAHKGEFRRIDIWDTMDHLEMVRKIYLSYEPKCWFEGYGKFMIQKEIPRRLEKLNLGFQEEKNIKDRLEQMLKPQA